MSKWSVYLCVLIAGSIHTAEIAASHQQLNPGGHEPSIFVGFDDILSRIPIVNDHVKKVFKREADDFTIDDEITLQNASSEPLPAPVDVQSSKDVLSDEDADESISSAENIASEETTSEKIETSAENELDESKENEKGNDEIKPDGLIAIFDKDEEGVKDKNVSTETVLDESSTVESEEVSAENMAVVIDPKIGETKDRLMGKLMEAEEGSGDNFFDSESESADIADTTDTAETTDKKPLDEVEEVTAVDISIDEDSNETTDTPDEIPIPNPIALSNADSVSVSKEESTTVDAFKVDELIRVTTEIADAALGQDSEGSGASSEEGVVIDSEADSKESEENESTSEKTDPHVVLEERKVVVPVESNPVETPAETENAPQEAEETDGIPLKKAILSTGSEDVKEKSINEMGVQNEVLTPTDEEAERKSASSSGSYIVLGAIMVTICVLLGYTVIKSRRQKRARRSADIAKAAEEDPGREMKEVDKLLSPKTNGFSNGGPKEDDRLEGNTDAEDFNDVPIRGEEFAIRLNGVAKNGHLPEKGVEELTDVIVENVPRLNATPVANAATPSENGSENDPGAWVYGDGKALETTKIKMYIDEDSIPKTPIVVVNRGPTPNEM